MEDWLENSSETHLNKVFEKSLNGSLDLDALQRATLEQYNKNKTTGEIYVKINGIIIEKKKWFLIVHTH